MTDRLIRVKQLGEEPEGAATQRAEQAFGADALLQLHQMSEHDTGLQSGRRLKR